MATIMRIGGGGSAGGNVIFVEVDTGATVYATNGTKTVSGVSVDGACYLKVPEVGTWTVWAEKDGDQSSTDEIVIYDEFTADIGFSVPLSKLPEGTLIKLNESGSGVNFYLAKHDYESGLNGAGRTLLARTVCYPEEMKWHSSSSGVYSASSINSWCQNTYKAKLDTAVQSLIGTTTIYVTSSRSSAGSLGTYNASVFIPSSTEAGNGSDGYWSLAEGSALPIKTTLMRNAGSYWCRTPLVRSDNRISGNGFNATATTSGHYALPMFTLPATAKVFSEPNADGSYTLNI